eukprot:3332722-Lingulodinium_polyedra.AAC.1
MSPMTAMPLPPAGPADQHGGLLGGVESRRVHAEDRRGVRAQRGLQGGAQGVQERGAREVGHPGKEVDQEGREEGGWEVAWLSWVAWLAC